MSTFRIPQRGPIDLIDDVTSTDELVDVSLTAGHQVENKDAPAEIPKKQIHRCFFTSPRAQCNGNICGLEHTNLRTNPTSRQGTTSYISHT